MKLDKVILFTLIGAAAGAVAGILYAPAKGTVTRKRLLRKGNDAVDAAGDTAEEYADDLSDAFESFTARAAKVYRNSKALLNGK